jgi:hypothetical protein
MAKQESLFDKAQENAHLNPVRLSRLARRAISHQLSIHPHNYTDFARRISKFTGIRAMRLWYGTAHDLCQLRCSEHR